MAGHAILWLCGAKDGCWWYRAELPRRWLAARGHDVRMTNGEGEDVGHIDNFGAVVLQRLGYNTPEGTAQMKSFLRALQARGARTYYEMDDDLWRSKAPADFLAAPRWMRRYLMSELSKLLGAADAAIATTPDLAKVLGKHNRRVTVIPNAVPADLCDVPRPAHGGAIRIGWAGGGSHGPHGDFETAAPALREVVEARADVSLHFMGWHPPEVESWPRTTRSGWTPIAQYYNALVSCGFDIFVAPLADTRFNQSKSASKLMEAGALGCAVVAEPHGPYAGFLEHEQTGLYVSTSAEWSEALLRLCEDRPLRERLGAALRHTVRGRNTMEQTGPLWAEALAVPLTEPDAVAVGASEE